MRSRCGAITTPPPPPTTDACGPRCVAFIFPPRYDDVRGRRPREARYVAREAGGAAARLRSPLWNGHGRKLVAAHRRRRGRVAHVRGAREGRGLRAPGLHPLLGRVGRGSRRPAPHGPGLRHPQGAGASRSLAGRDGPHRDRSRSPRWWLSASRRTSPSPGPGRSWAVAAVGRSTGSPECATRSIAVGHPSGATGAHDHHPSNELARRGLRLLRLRPADGLRHGARAVTCSHVGIQAGRGMPTASWSSP